MTNFDGAVTMADVAKQTVNGMVPEMARLLEQTNAIGEFMRWMPTNKETYHVTVVETGIPQPSLRRLNQGISPTKGTAAQIEDGMAHIENRAIMDVDMPAGSAGNLAKIRLNHSRQHIEGFMQYFAYLLFYGNQALDERQFNGLASRYNAITGNVADNVINAGGTGTDNMSVWLVDHGEGGLTGINPPGDTAGLQHEDKGTEFVTTSVTAGSESTGFYAYVDRFVMKAGITIPDWRRVVRICNVDLSDLVGATGTQASSASTYLIDLMADAIERIPNAERRSSNLKFYCTRTAKTWIRRQSAVKAANTITFSAPAGTTEIPVLRAHGVPVHVCDQLLHTEDDVPVSVSDFP